MFDFSGFNFEKALSRLYIYTGVFLTEWDRNRLLNHFRPKHPVVYADHATLCFKPSIEQVEIVKKENFPELFMEVVGYAEDDKAQAVSVAFIWAKLPDKGIEIKNEILHVTISCAEGVSPAYSNELLKNVKPWPGIITMGFIGILGVCAQTDRNHLPQEMWKRRGL